jgi:hypothetical protein
MFSPGMKILAGVKSVRKTDRWGKIAPPQHELQLFLMI